MFGSLVESRREPRSRLRWLTLQVALGMHVLILSAIGIHKWLEVPPIPEPPMRASIVTDLAPPPPPPAPAPKPVVAKVQKVPTPAPPENVQPQQVPQEVASSRFPFQKHPQVPKAWRVASRVVCPVVCRRPHPHRQSIYWVGLQLHRY